MPAAALWISGDAQARVRWDEDRSLVRLHPGGCQPALAACQTDQRWRVCNGEWIGLRVVSAQADAIQEQCQYRHELGRGLGAVVIMGEQEGVGLALASNGGDAHVAGQDLHVIVEDHQLVDD